MIDKILDLKDDMSMEEYNDLFCKAKSNKDARTLFLMAYFIKNADIEELSSEVLKKL